MLLFQTLIFVIFCFTRSFAVAAAATITAQSPNILSTTTAASAISTDISSTSILPPTLPSTTTKTTVKVEENNGQPIPTTSKPSASMVAVEKCLNDFKGKEKEEERYLCFLKIREMANWKDGLSYQLRDYLHELEDPRFGYHTPGISDNGIIIMAVVLGLLILIGNGAALGYFFRWNFQPLSRRPTDDELDDVLDADLPVILINRDRQDQANDFQFGAKIEKDVQTIMTSDNNQQQTEQQQSSMPDELKSVVPDNQDGGGMPGGALLPPPPAARIPRRARGGGKRGGAGGGGGRRGGGGGGRGHGRR